MQSSVFPDRLIRPLPKRSLKSRLSQEAAESIPFPPNPPSSSFPAYNQYGGHGEYVNDSKVLVQQDEDYCDDDHDDDHHHHHHHHHYHEHDHDIHHHHHHLEDDEDAQSMDDEDLVPATVRRTMGYRGSSSSPRTTRNSRHAPSKASYSGSDGYDAFENTNNKKKRKIPTSGSIGLHQSSISTELAHLGLNGSRNDLAVSQDNGAAYQGSLPYSANLLSGVGRARYSKDSSRRVSNRNPLGVSTSNSNIRPGSFGVTRVTGLAHQSLEGL